MLSRFLLCGLTVSLCLPTPVGSGDAVSSPCAHGKHVATKARLDELLLPPPCLGKTDAPYVVEEVTITSGDVELAAQLYLPETPGKRPAVVLMHGGGNDYDLLMSAPRYYARRLVRCGFAALVFDKRGTGNSGGVFGQSTFGDFIADAGNAARYLQQHTRIDTARVVVYGGSGGGRLAPVVAVRYPFISAVISASGPIGSVADQFTYNMRYALEVRGHPDSIIERVMPLWKRHHDSWATMDEKEFEAVAQQVFELRKTIDPLALPNTRDELLTDSNLAFLLPGFLSMSRNYTDELRRLSVPWLSLYGAHDRLLDVEESIRNIQTHMAAGRHEDYEIICLEGVDHSFFDTETGRQLPIVNIIVNWLQETMGPP